MAVELAIVCEPTVHRKIPLREENARQQAHLIKALADPTRMQLISFLARYEGEVCVKEIVECFALAQPTISHHMRILREAGIVDYRKEALYAYISCAATHWITRAGLLGRCIEGDSRCFHLMAVLPGWCFGRYWSSYLAFSWVAARMSAARRSAIRSWPIRQSLKTSGRCSRWTWIAQWLTRIS